MPAAELISGIRATSVAAPLEVPIRHAAHRRYTEPKRNTHREIGTSACCLVDI